MADNILKLKVESSEYDAKLKKAAEGIRHLAEVAHQGGGELTGLEKAELDYVKALGEMETKSRTAAGSVRELESTYKELKVIYDQLNDVEKADEGGKALAASLEQIKTRAQEAKAQLDTATQSLNDNGQEAKGSSGALDALASKFTINIDALKLFDMGLKAAGVALDVAKDAFFNNEEQLDEWGRIVETSQSLYEGFLNALNTGDISGFLTNIGRIERAARDAYDALDALGTYNAFNQINIERTRTNMTESIAEFRGGKGTKEGVKSAGDAYKKELADRQRLENEAYIAAVKEMAAKRGANAKDLMDALSGTYGHYQDLKNVQPSGTRTRYIPGLPGQAGRYEEYKVAQNNQERLGEALRHLNDTELQSLQALGAQAQRTGTEIAQVDKQLTRVLNAKQPGTGSTGGNKKDTKTEQTELQKNQAEITKLTQQFVDINAEASRAGKPLTEEQKKQTEEIQKQIEKLKERNGLLGLFAEQAQGRLLPTNIQTGGLSNTPGTLLKAPTTAVYENGVMTEKAVPRGGLQLDDKAMRAVTKNLEKQQKKEEKKEQPIEGMSDLIGGVNNVFGGLQQIGIEIPQEIQSVMGVLNGIFTVVTGIESIITVGQFLGIFHNGGIVPHAANGLNVVGGTHYSGDVTPILANAGEVVLNHSQVNTLAQNLQGGGMQNLNLTATIKGEQIRLALNNNGRRTGRGEYVQSRNVR